MDTPEDVKKIARLIGQFYLDSYQGDYSKAHQALTDLDITDITLVESVVRAPVVNIKLYRPGLLIGEKGKNITKLNEYLCKELERKDLEIHIIEDRLHDYLFPTDWFSRFLY